MDIYQKNEQLALELNKTKEQNRRLRLLTKEMLNKKLFIEPKPDSVDKSTQTNLDELLMKNILYDLNYNLNISENQSIDVEGKRSKKINKKNKIGNQVDKEDKKNNVFFENIKSFLNLNSTCIFFVLLISEYALSIRKYI